MDSTMQDRPLTILDILEHGSSWNGRSRVWSTDSAGDTQESSFADIGLMAARLAGGLHALGIRPGDRVGSYCWNHAAHLAAYLAVPSMGAVLHTANIRLTAEQNIFTMQRAGDRALLVDASLLDDLLVQLASLPELETVIVHGGGGDLDRVVVRGKRVIAFDDLLALGSDTFGWPRLDERAPASLCFTTGTTGDPKGVVYSHRSTWLHSMSLCTTNAVRLGAEDRALIAVPMFHANAWGYPYAAFWSGADLVLPNRFVQPAGLVDQIEKRGVTFANGVPTVWKDVLRFLEHHPERDISSLQRLVVGGAAAPSSFIEDFGLRHGVAVVQGWGMTETSPLVTTARPPRGASEQAAREYRATQGRVLPGVRIRLVDPDTDAVLPADGEAVGEFELQGPWIAGGYLDNAGADKFRNGWLRTGDVGTLDADGFVRLTDRAKDVIKSGGEWISSVQLENLLSAHPQIEHVAVIGVPDEKWDERPLAVVVADAAGAPDPADLQAWLLETLPRWSVPDRWSIVDQIPMTSVGKIDKKVLRQRFAAGELTVQQHEPPRPTPTTRTQELT